jgi:hypothetical protein
MNFKVLTIATLLLSAVCFSTITSAEKMVESSKYKSERVEKDVNDVFQRAFRMAATELDTRQQVKPFAVIQKKDGKLGVFGLDSTEKNAKLTVDDQTASIRKYLIELVVADQINASVQVMYASVQQKDKTPRQGLIFEIEHIEGVSLLRFLPISKIKNDKGVETGKLLFEMESLTTTVKPQTVFAFAKAS